MPAPTRIIVDNLDRGEILGERILLADRWWSRARGLIGTTLGEGEGLLIRPCRAVHMFGMKYSIDVAFLDAGSQVVATYIELRPGRITRFHRSAIAALELPAGKLAETRTRVGDRLTITSTLTEA